jgi:GH18 family chitinase
MRHHSRILHQHHGRRRVSISHSTTPSVLSPLIQNHRAPGTAKKDTNGCISNCGTKVKSTSVVTGKPKRIGYFEAWNLNRKCANMDISKMTDGGDYTHVHWAFGNITESWEVDVSGLQDQFDGLLKLQGIQRIMSFGGWGFSTDAYTHNIFRNGVRDGNRQILAANVAKFIVDNGLDGVDFDWEYPGVSCFVCSCAWALPYRHTRLADIYVSPRPKTFQVSTQITLTRERTMPSS